MQHPASDVGASKSASGEEVIEIMRQVFSNQVRNFSRENDTKTFFRNIPPHHLFRIGIEDRAGGEDLRTGKPALSASYDYCRGAVAKQASRNQVSHRDILALQRQGAEFDREHDCGLIRIS